MNEWGYAAIVLLVGIILSVALFRRPYLDMASEQNKGFARGFVVHTLAGAGYLAACYFLARTLRQTGVLAIIAAAAGWTIPALIMVVLAVSSLKRRAANSKKEG